MTIIVNKCFGGYSTPSAFLREYHLAEDEVYDIQRTDPRLVAFVKARGGVVAVDRGTKLVAVEIPDAATDWVLNEYDGMESIIYVLNGKIRYA